MKKILALGTVPLAVVGTVGVAVPAQAYSIGGGMPRHGEASFKWLKAGCSMTDQNGYRAVVKARSWVNKTRNPGKRYYQIISIDIDAQTAGGGWTKVGGQKADRARFTGSAVPTHSTASYATSVGAGIGYGGTLRGYMKVTLKQVRPGPDKSVWTYTVHSNPFVCYEGAIGYS